MARKLGSFESNEQATKVLKKNFTVIDDVLIYCFIKNSGIAYGWGMNDHGQITGQISKTVPEEIKSFENVTSIIAGDDTSFITKNEGLFAVGINDNGQLGLGERIQSIVITPKKVTMPPIKSLESRQASYAVDTTGRLWSWGYNVSGQLGYEFEHGRPVFTTNPRIIDSLKDYEIKQVACGNSFACCLTTGGEVFTWGDKDLIGHGQLVSDVRLPKKLDVEKICQISCGWGNTLLLSSDQKTVWAFGENGFGELGRGPEITSSEVPVRVPFLGTKVIRKLQCGDYCSAALTEDGQIIMWGSLLGNMDDENTHIPRVIELKQKVIDISMSGEFMLVLTVENRLYAFGRNRCGQCGQGTWTDSIEQPVEVKNLENLRIKQISAGHNHCLIKCTKI